MDYSYTINRLRQWCSSDNQRNSLGQPQAAILIPILNKNGVPHFILTKRSEELNKHSGQISFPGGKIDVGENVIQTAMRETYEEIGVKVKQTDILGIFHDFSTPFYSSVTPVIAQITEPQHYIPSEEEIALIMEAPIPDLLDESIHWTEVWSRNGQDHLIHFYKWRNNGSEHVIWGATAGVIDKLLQLF